jgi:hypothetical protein
VSRKVVQRFEWRYRGRTVVVVEFRASGPPDITVAVGKSRVEPAFREAAAFWLCGILERLTHDEAYARLWHWPTTWRGS